MTAENGDYIICGILAITYDDIDALLVELDDSGNTIWSHNYGSLNREIPTSIIPTLDGGYLLTCDLLLLPYWDTCDALLLKTGSEGNLLWSKRYGSDHLDDGFSSVIQTYDGGYLAVGKVGVFVAGWVDLWLVKTSLSGDSLWSQTYGGSGGEWPSDLLILENGDYLIGGTTSSYGNGYTNFWLLCVEGLPLGIKPSPVSASSADFKLYNPSPNPFNPVTVIGFEMRVAGFVKLMVYDIQGREVAKLVEGYKGAGNHEVIFDGSELSSGIYFARLEAGGYVKTQKMLLVK